MLKPTFVGGGRGVVFWRVQIRLRLHCRYNVKARTVASSGRSAWAYAVARVGNAPQTTHITPQMATATHASVTFAWTEPPDDRSRTYTYRGELMPADDVNETTGFCACGTWSGVYNASVDPGFNSTCA